ncbi:hypothetical protein [Marinisporobacter balticus]|uniref:Uncharacterized protein n=1 Tax=Marinisporobacter balticus TaxID=2018667 RepID=A0A4R2L0U3_9FIRM|nr:hypothetical protein [Marinisporobacter balticus]TCO80044.1 hypothetical protein EV214_101282 [Marinisporobacter balticus]
MDFDKIISILLPLIFFIGQVIFKKDNKEKLKHKNDAKKDKKNDYRDKGNKYIKGFEEKAQGLKDEIHSTLENMEVDDYKGQAPMIYEAKVENDHRQVNVKGIPDVNTSNKSIEIKETAIKEEIRDVICEREIGKKGILINKNNLIYGIIMSEILEKPKSLRR